MGTASSSHILRRCVLSLAIAALLVGICLAAVANIRPAASPPPPRRFNTYAHRMLDFEAERFQVPPAQYALLDDIITEVQARVGVAEIVGDSGARQRHVLRVLRTIDDVLVENGFLYATEYWHTTLSQALTPKTLSRERLDRYLKDDPNARRRRSNLLQLDRPIHVMACQQGSMLYIGVTEALGIELRMVSVPLHIFCRARVAEDRWINWDTNMGRIITDDEYARNYNVSDDQIKQGVYLATFYDDRAIAVAYAGRGMRSRNQGNFNRAAEDLQRAVDLDARSPLNLAALAMLYSQSPLAINADAAKKATMLSLASRAAQLDPNLPFAHDSVASASAEMGDFPAAIAAQKRALELAEEDDDRTFARERLNAFTAGQTAISIMRARQPLVFWLCYDRGWRICAGVIAALIVLRRLIFARPRPAAKTPPAHPAAPAFAGDTLQGKPPPLWP